MTMTERETRSPMYSSADLGDDHEVDFMGSGRKSKAAIPFSVKDKGRMKHGVMMVGLVEDFGEEVVSGKVKGDKQENFEFQVLAEEREQADTTGLPGFTFGVGERFPAYKDKNVRDLPGPGQYAPKDPKLLGKTPGPRKGRLFGARTPLAEEIYNKRQQKPGPNKYYVSADFGKPRVSRYYTFGSSSRGDPSGGSTQRSHAPGPGAYDVPDSLRANTHKGYFRYAETRHVPRKPLKPSIPGPSPAEYDVERTLNMVSTRRSTPVICIGTARRRDLTDTEQTPGPGAYEPDYITEMDDGAMTARSQPVSIRYAFAEERAQTARGRMSADSAAHGPPTGFGVPQATGSQSNAPAYTIGSRPSSRRRVLAFTPGPGAYQRTGMGDGSGLQYSFGTKPSAKVQAVLLAQPGRDAPGPGKYDVKDEEVHGPAYSIASRHYPPSHLVGAEDNGDGDMSDPGPGPVYDPENPAHKSDVGALFAPRSPSQRLLLKEKLEMLSAQQRVRSSSRGAADGQPESVIIAGASAPGPGRYNPHKPFGTSSPAYSIGSRTYGPGYALDGIGAETGKSGISGGPGPAYDVSEFPDDKRAFVFTSRRKYHAGELRVGGVPFEESPGPAYDTRVPWNGPCVVMGPAPPKCSSPKKSESFSPRKNKGVPSLDLHSLRGSSRPTKGI